MALRSPATAFSAAGSPGTVEREQGWEPAPSAPFDRAAGVNCDFAVHAEPVVDKVVTKVLRTYPDGSIRTDAFKAP